MKQNIRRFAAASAIAAISLGGLVACGSDDDTASKSNTNTSAGSSTDKGDKADAPAGAIAVELKEYEIIPPDITADAGAITFDVKNSGTIEHDFTIEGHEDAKIDVKKPGTDATGTVTLTAGDYVIYCSIPGHKEMGMVGTLTVK